MATRLPGSRAGLDAGAAVCEAGVACGFGACERGTCVCEAGWRRPRLLHPEAAVARCLVPVRALCVVLALNLCLIAALTVLLLVTERRREASGKRRLIDRLRVGVELLSHVINATVLVALGIDSEASPAALYCGILTANILFVDVGSFLMMDKYAKVIAATAGRLTGAAMTRSGLASITSHLIAFALCRLVLLAFLLIGGVVDLGDTALLMVIVAQCILRNATIAVHTYAICSSLDADLEFAHSNSMDRDVSTNLVALRRKLSLTKRSTLVPALSGLVVYPSFLLVIALSAPAATMVRQTFDLMWLACDLLLAVYLPAIVARSVHLCRSRRRAGGVDSSRTSSAVLSNAKVAPGLGETTSVRSAAKLTQ